jgi:hypothetical protein
MAEHRGTRSTTALTTLDAFLDEDGIREKVTLHTVAATSACRPRYPSVGQSSCPPPPKRQMRAGQLDAARHRSAQSWHDSVKVGHMDGLMI